MKVIDFGLTKYEECYKLQKAVLESVKTGKLDEHLIITEHQSVITIGRTGSRANLVVSEEFLRQNNIAVVETDRGGDITYHGPGQIIVYPIIDLKMRQKDLHKYLRGLESIIIDFLKKYNMKSYSMAGKTGVWTDKGKIASIGIGVSGWVTYHGLSLNVTCDLKPFKWINPCGFKDISVTSMQEVAGVEFCKKDIKSILTELFHEKYQRITSVA